MLHLEVVAKTDPAISETGPEGFETLDASTS